MFEDTVILDPPDVFEGLVLSDAFESRSASIEEKRLIFGRAWAESNSWLRSNFDSTGKNPVTEQNGFGFLIESFAKHSKVIPRHNTKKGEEAALTILSELQLGKEGHIGLSSKRANSDFLWVELRGRRIIITGIGEIKASYQAAFQKIGGQLKRQEQSLEFLVKGLKSAKVKKSVSGFFQNRSIVVTDRIDKFLFVPFGQGESIRQDDDFSDWRVVEIEFSYNELVFIAQKIWPRFRPDINFNTGSLYDLFQIASNLSEWIKPRIDRIFSDSVEFNQHNPLPYFELGLFFLATGKTPLMEDEVRWSSKLVQESFWPAIQRCLNLFANSVPQPESDFLKRDKAILARFWYVLTSNRGDIEWFIYFCRSLNSQIKDLVRSQHQFNQLENMSEAWKV